MKKFIHYFFKFIIIVVFCWSIFFVAKILTDTYINLQTSNQDVTIIKKNTKEIIIPYIYTYNSNTKFYDYVKDWEELKTIEQVQQRIEKQYWENMKKKDKLYDTFYVQSKWKRYEVNLSELWKYDFKSLLDTFSTAPYYDKELKTLYIFSHSSWKIINPWKDYYDFKIWEKIDFIDYDGNVSDEYVVESVDIVSKNEFNNKIFLSISDRIVLVTCYPLNSTAKRLYVVLKKVN